MRYYSLNQYCKDTFGEKIYRLSLDAGMTCPNRDGLLSDKGCFFCSAGGSGDFAEKTTLSIYDQIESAKKQVQSKTKCNKFIAYFQAYTNTYAPIEKLREIFTEAISKDDIVALSIGTRSDCLGDDVLLLLQELNQIKPVWVELGYQSMHNASLASMNTHTSLEQFDRAVHSLNDKDIPVIAHVILGLPNETKEMMLESVKHLADIKVSGIKLQLLHVLKDTVLAQIYTANPFPIFELDEYCDFVIDCLEILPPDMVIHRLTGDGPRNLLVAPLWSTDKKRVLNTINKKLKDRDTYQGRLYKKENTDGRTIYNI